MQLQIIAFIRYQKNVFCSMLILVLSIISLNANVESQQINNKNDLRLLLNETEWISIIGPNTHLKDVCFSLLWATFENKTGKLVLKTDLLDRKIELFLRNSQRLLAPKFTVIKRWANRSEIFSVNHMTEDDQCHYRGIGIALTLCGKIRGIITLEDYYYTIHPLPHRLQLLFKSIPYIIVKKSHKKKQFQCKFSTNNEVHINIINEHKRKRRSIDNDDNQISDDDRKEIFVETAVFVDQDLFRHMTFNYPHETEKELIRFVLAMINAVQLLYHDASLGRQVNFLIKRLEILHEEPVGLVRSLDIDEYLNSFCIWQKEHNRMNDFDPQHWDHALILTGLDLYVINRNGKISNQVVGLAPVSGMCTKISSCTVNEGRHFESVYVVAHEIGHNLGMRHDGPLANNNCDSSSFIMSPTLGSGKTTWSSCSRNYLDKFLKSIQSKCLMDYSDSIDQLDHSKSASLPGERFDADQQCMLKYGNGSRHANQQSLKEICRDLHCERERYTWTSHPALEGSECGKNLWCRSGLCVPKTNFNNEDGFLAESNDIYENKANLKEQWSDWQTNNKCRSSCIYSDNTYQELSSIGIITYIRECLNSGKNTKCEGINRKYYTCKSQDCENMSRVSIYDFMNNICQEARKTDHYLTGYGVQKLSYDRDDACTVWCEKTGGGLRNHGLNLPDGTKCNLIGKYSTNTRFCINGRCEDFFCKFENQSQFVHDPNTCSTKMTIKKTKPQRRHTSDRIEWIPISGCFFNCIRAGIGFRLISKHNDRFKSNIKLCDSPKNNCLKLKTSVEFATNVCNSYRDKVQRLSGIGFQLPSTKSEPHRGCKVACQDERLLNRFYIVHGSSGWFPFGTNCTKDNSTHSYCLRGYCIDFGQNKMPTTSEEFSISTKIKKRKKRHLPKISDVHRTSNIEANVVILNVDTLL